MVTAVTLYPSEGEGLTEISYESAGVVDDKMLLAMDKSPFETEIEETKLVIRLLKNTLQTNQVNSLVNSFVLHWIVVWMA
jgi:hypothetical protein